MNSDELSRWWPGSPGTVAQLRQSYLNFTGPRFLLNGPGSYMAPFTLVGSLCGVIPIGTWNMGNRYCDGDFPLLEGSGIATFNYGPVIGIGRPADSVYFLNASYTFQSPNQTPELSTGMTTLTAVCFIAMRCFLRLKRSPFALKP